MTERKIILNGVNDVKNFVNIVSKFPFEADLVSGRHIIDAKSLMGIFSLDTSKPVTLKIDSEDDCVFAFLDEISPYIVK